MGNLSALQDVIGVCFIFPEFEWGILGSSCTWMLRSAAVKAVSITSHFHCRYTFWLCGIGFISSRGVARIFQRGGHHPGIAEYTWFKQLLSLVFQRALSYYCGMKAHINYGQEPLTKILYKKTNFRKVGFSTMAFTANILSWRFCHLNIVGCLLKRIPTKGG